MNADEFRQAMTALPEPPNDPWPKWNFWRHSLWIDGQTKSLEQFTTWAVVNHCFLSYWLPLDLAWEQVKDDLPRYGPAMESVPNVRTYNGYDFNMIKMVGWLAFWEKCTGRRIEDVERIMEIGGGFGAMRLALDRLGFHGEHGILDFPEMALLQRWFLSQYGIERQEWHSCSCDILIAMCSLSEIPLADRDRIVEQVIPDTCLFEYSPKYDQDDNLTYFNGLREKWGGKNAILVKGDMTTEILWR